MTVHNTDIANIFNRMAELLEIEDANLFRVRAYRRAAQTLQDLGEPAAALLARGQDLDDLPGIGEDLAGKIAEICRTGRLKALEELEARTPSSLAQLTAVPGLGPKRARALHERLGVETVADLAQAAAAGKVRSLPRFGEAFEKRLLASLAAAPNPGQGRLRLASVEEQVGALLTFLRAAPGVTQAAAAGSYRRRRETVGDLDLLAISPDGQAVANAFAAHEDVAQVLGKGSTRVTVVLTSGLQVDLRIVPKQSYGAALLYFTGSKEHNIALRKLGQAAGLKINEYGVFRGETRIAGRTEEEVYASVGLPYIEPELREARGEIAAAQARALPRLLTLADLKGDLHIHTRASDGQNRLEDMVEAARARGYAYVAVSDHSRHATVAHGLDPERLSAQIEAIDRLNAGLKDFRVLRACEVDILADGTLDLPDDILERLDLVVGAIHSDFGLSARAQTERVLRAMDNRLFNIFAHPTGRLIGERPGYEIDLDQVMKGALERGCFLELNAHPSRLDLDDVHCRAAKAMGLKLALSSDAHSTLGLANIRYGVDQARRGWLGPEDVINSRSWSGLKPMLAR
ncbi:MAG: DNA polymerase/3'-5' exonuclease PolX [Caulobacteraceae bacterium]